MIIDLTGKTALVTGSTAGIGRAIGKGLAAAGASVIVNGRKQGTVDKVVAALGAEVPGGKVRGVAADVATAAGCDALVRAAPDVDILVNNAGIFEPKSFFEISDADWTRFFETNVMSGVRLSRALMPGSEEALRYGFQTLEEATQYWRDLAKIRPHVAAEERIRSLQVLASALEEAPFSDEYMMLRRLAEGICAASGRSSCLTCRPGPRASRNSYGMSPICSSK